MPPRRRRRRLRGDFWPDIFGYDGTCRQLFDVVLLELELLGGDGQPRTAARMLRQLESTQLIYRHMCGALPPHP